MEKDLWKWHDLKLRIDCDNKRPFYREGEVRWCAVGLNIGFEINGKGVGYWRPVIILKGFSQGTCLCAPLTTKNKTGKYYHSIFLSDGVARKAVLSQVRTMDTKRLREIIGKIDGEQLGLIKQAAADIILGP